MTATPTVPAPGVATQQWMCATVEVPLVPDHETSMLSVCATSSYTTVPLPVPVAPEASGPNTRL